MSCHVANHKGTRLQSTHMTWCKTNTTILFLQTDMPCCKLQRNQVAITHMPCCKQIQPLFFANWQMQLDIISFFSSRCKCTMLQSNTTNGCKQTQVYSLVAIKHIFYFLFRRKQHTHHVANHKGTRLQSHTCHVANKHKPLCLQTDRCNFFL
jgi:hypothetical protein